jgi:16S rRNA (cytosine967-C5)-methyltransferase
VLQVASATPAALPGFNEGWFTIQDEASVLVATALGAQPGQRIMDACAGPGGKASLLAWHVAPDGSVIAADASRARARLVRDAGRRLGLRIPVVAMDASHPGLREASFDAVLVDAPCSGIGAARRRPELLWRVEKTHLSALARLQVAILQGVAGLVRPGGRLVYSVCTFPRAETDAVVRSFLSGRPDVEPSQVPGPDGPAVTHRLWPHRHGTDGMFYAGFTRVAGSTG